MAEGIDLGKWEKIVQRARNARTLEPGLADISGMPHDKADKILALEEQRLERDRIQFLERHMDRPGQVLRQSAKKKRANWGEDLLDRAIKRIK